MWGVTCPVRAFFQNIQKRTSQQGKPNASTHPMNSSYYGQEIL